MSFKMSQCGGATGFQNHGGDFKGNLFTEKLNIGLLYP